MDLLLRSTVVLDDDQQAYGESHCLFVFGTLFYIISCFEQELWEFGGAKRKKEASRVGCHRTKEQH
jgi:hypothetical protein